MPELLRLVRRIRFGQLALIVAIDEHRNLRRAAAAVHLAQPSATKILHDLEELFGFELFERLPRGMHPTELGAEVISFARRMLVELERFGQDLESKRTGGYGHLMIGAIMGAAPDVVAHAMADIKRKRPLLAIRLIGETSDEIIKSLLERKIDVAVGRFSNPLQHNTIDFEALGNEEVFLVARHAHPVARMRGLQLRALADYPWILQPISSPARHILEQEFGQAGMATPANVVECTSIFATLQLLQKSDALTLLPESVVRDYLSAGLLMRVPLAVGASLPGFGILTRRGEPLSTAATEFIQSLRQYGALMDQRLGARRLSLRKPRAAAASSD